MKPQSIRLWIAEILLLLSMAALVPRARPQTVEVLHFFQNSDGVRPNGLIQGRDGNFYGTTVYGGFHGDRGTVFRITPAGAFTTLNTFDDNEGIHPIGLVEGSDGNFYGTTSYNVFRMTPSGAATTLVLRGASGALVEGADGNFYGTTLGGGPANDGTVFKVTPAGELTTLVFFAKTNGSRPQAGLIKGSDGNFYGTTSEGGTNIYWGTVFRMTPAGELTTLVSFNGINGRNPISPLVQGSDGNFYSTTQDGGTNVNGGTVFKVTPGGTLATLVSFQYGGTNGSYPSSALVQGIDGNFYGTTQGSGASPSDNGTAFRMTPDGVLTTLVSFSRTNGNVPSSALVQGSDGNFYGTTWYGGTNESAAGVIFRVVMPVSLKVRPGLNEIVLSWPTNATGFTLQWSTNLNAPVAWADSTNLPAVVGNQFTVTNVLSGNARFFRLTKQ